MLISSVSLSNNYGLNKPKTLPKSNTQSKSKVSFSAKRLPSGDYSDWFFDLVKKTLSLSKTELNKFVKEKLGFDLYKYSDVTEYKKNNFLAVRKDLKNSEKVEDLGLQDYDEPVGRYLEPLDYNLENPGMTEDERIKEELRSRYPDEYFP